MKTIKLLSVCLVGGVLLNTPLIALPSLAPTVAEKEENTQDSGSNPEIPWLEAVSGVYLETRKLTS